MPTEIESPSQIAEQEKRWYNFSLASFLAFCGLTYTTAVKDIESQKNGDKQSVKTLAFISLSALITAAISGYKSFSLSQMKLKAENEAEKQEWRRETISLVKETLAQQQESTTSKTDSHWQKKQETLTTGKDLDVVR